MSTGYANAAKAGCEALSRKLETDFRRTKDVASIAACFLEGSRVSVHDEATGETHDWAVDEFYTNLFAKFQGCSFDIHHRVFTGNVQFLTGTWMKQADFQQVGWNTGKQRVGWATDTFVYDSDKDKFVALTVVWNK